MSVSAGIVSPHPPILIPEIGRAELGRVKNTIDALNEAGRFVKETAPDVLVFISPHSPIAGDVFCIREGDKLFGSFARFGYATEQVLKNDAELAAAIAQSASSLGVKTAPIPPEMDGGLDWGVLVPYHFVGNGLPIVSLSISAYDYESHALLGKSVSAACDRLGRKAVFVASGDLSHRLSEVSPYGFSPAGPEFDKEIADIFTTGDLRALDRLDPSLIAEAGECGLRSFYALRGALSGSELESKLLSYEGPFGIGYAVAWMRPLNEPAVGGG